jgi:Ca2+-binding RTX toxin-like protein
MSQNEFVSAYPGPIGSGADTLYFLTMGAPSYAYMGARGTNELALVDVDTQKVYLVAGESYTFTVQGSTYPTATAATGLNLELLGTDFSTSLGTLSVVGGVTTITYTAATSGVHYLRTSLGAGGTDGSYQISYQNTVADDHAATFAGATAYTLGMLQNGIMDQAGDADAFRFSVTAGKRYIYEQSVSENTVARIKFSDSNYNRLTATRVNTSYSTYYTATFTGEMMVEVQAFIRSDTASSTASYIEVDPAGGAPYSFVITQAYSDTLPILGGSYGNDTLNGTAAAEELHGGFGVDLVNGLGGNDILVGGPTGDLSADTLAGGTGDDLYYVLHAGVVVTEALDEGTDTVTADFAYTLGDNVENLVLNGTGNINGTGNALNNSLTGTTGRNLLQGLDGNDTLDGGTGQDTLDGGAGDDTFIVGNTNITVLEAAGGGTDTVLSSINVTMGALGAQALANVENLTLTGTGDITGQGNNLANVLTGNSGNNILTGLGGADTLDGGAGADTLRGGAGNDVYIVDASDVVEEVNSLDGNDTVRAAFSYTLGTNVDNLELQGTENLTGTGNTAANRLVGNSGNNSLLGDLGDDTLEGGLGNDSLDGGTGNDSMAGGGGDDAYTVTATLDVVTEAADEGTDTITSSVTYTLAANVENLVLTGATNINGTGNAGDNSLIGNAGNSTLTGLDGNDTLDGGAGTDTLVGGTGDDSYVVDSTTR